MLSICAMGASIVSRDITQDDRHWGATLEAPIRQMATAVRQSGRSVSNGGTTPVTSQAEVAYEHLLLTREGDRGGQFAEPRR